MKPPHHRVARIYTLLAVELAAKKEPYREFSAHTPVDRQLTDSGSVGVDKGGKNRNASLVACVANPTWPQFTSREG